MPIMPTPRPLSPREQDVLGLICQGCPNKDIAFKLTMKEATVKVHCRAIFRKLGVTNRTQALIAAGENIGH